ncbi:MAG TPA: hypothetical protein VFV87_17590, partial [Pirellulaceae bacterium]|nr:hypothetical protein [Pirellulaceae bacterium]
KARDAKIEEQAKTIAGLAEKLTELEAKLARVSDESSVVNQPQGSANPACISQSLMHPTPGVSSRVHGAERNARMSDASSVVNQSQGSANPACISQSLMHPTPAAPATLDESRIAQTTPAQNQTSPDSQVAKPIAEAPSGDALDLPPAVSQRPESDESRPASPTRKPPTWVTVLGPGGRLIWLKKPEK